jgi:hypothetical protein
LFLPTLKANTIKNSSTDNGFNEENNQDPLHQIGQRWFFFFLEHTINALNSRNKAKQLKPTSPNRPLGHLQNFTLCNQIITSNPKSGQLKRYQIQNSVR